MPLRNQTAAVLVLASAFLAVVCGGEAWHLVPGSGHWTSLPAGYLCVGIHLPANASVPDGCGASGRLDRQRPALGPTEDCCLICQISGQHRIGSGAVEYVRWLTCHTDLPAVATRVDRTAAASPFNVRAPPSV